MFFLNTKSVIMEKLKLKAGQHISDHEVEQQGKQQHLPQLGILTATGKINKKLWAAGKQGKSAAQAAVSLGEGDRLVYVYAGSTQEPWFRILCIWFWKIIQLDWQPFTKVVIIFLNFYFFREMVVKCSGLKEWIPLSGL